MPDDGYASRRRFIAGTLAVSGSAWLQACAEFRDTPIRMPADPAAGLPFIDAHCHVFNVQDIPVYEFACHVGLDIDERHERGLIRSILERVSATLVASAPSVRAEEVLLTKMLADKAADPRRFDLSSYRDGLHTGEEVVARCLAAIFAGAPAGRAPYCRNPLLDKPLSTDDIRAALERRTTLPIASAPPQLLQSIASELLVRPGPVGTVMRWLVLLTRFRFAIAGRLFGLYGDAASGVNIATPAMVDYDLWLGEGRDLFETETLTRQVRVMEQLARLFDGRIAPLVPFDPWRQALWNLRAARGQTGLLPSPLAIVEEAIERRGFVGVKVYPPMGFQPLGNADFRPRPGDDPTKFPAGHERDFGSVQNFALGLDRALNDLYALCRRQSIPIMTHTRDSQSLVHRLGLRANPRHWERVIAAYRPLRVNLAHLGNMYELAGDRPTQTVEQGWADKALFLIDRYDNAFGDVGYLEYIAAYGDTSEATAAWRAKAETFFTSLGQALQKYPRAGQRIMYGSDWNMLGHVRGHENYQRAFASAFKLRQPNLYERFMGGAAAEFFGLYEYDRNSRPSGGFERQRRFFARHKMCAAAAFQARYFGGRGPDGRMPERMVERDPKTTERLAAECPGPAADQPDIRRIGVGREAGQG